MSGSTKNAGASIDWISEDERRYCDGLYFRILKEAGKCYVPNKKLLDRAYQLAFEKHAGQRRKGGQPYITHPLEVALILAEEVGVESDVLAAALLHDVIEDCDVTKEQLAQEFGEQVASAVDAVTQVNLKMCNDPEISKDDLDQMSDSKLVTKVLETNGKRGLLIKLADRIHNLRTISICPLEKQLAKAEHTRRILIPVAKKLQIFKFVYILEDLCLKVEKPEVFHVIREGYARLLSENACVLEDEEPGEKGFRHYFTDVVTNRKSILGQYVASVTFARRHEASIYRHLVNEMDDFGELGRSINKKNVELYNIHFTVKDQAPGTPESIFLQFYPELYQSPWRLTVTAISRAIESQTRCWVLEDRYGIRYRLFMQTETGLLTYSHGSTNTGEEDDIRGHIPVLGAEELPEEAAPKIRVFRRNGRMDEIEKGASVLDFAFHLNPMIGICAVNATLNHSRVRVPLHVRLSEGDLVEIHSDHDRDHPEQDIPHATIRWVEYLHTASARKALTRWLEVNTDKIGSQNIVVYSSSRDASGRHEIPIGSTVLDYMLLVYGSQVFDGFEAYINSSRKPADLNRILKYEDLIKAAFGDERVHKPCIEWFNIIKTAGARKKLVEYYEMHL